MEFYKKITTKYGVVYKKVDKSENEGGADVERIEEANQMELDSESNGYNKITPDTLLTKEQREMVEEAIARQDKQLASGNFEVVERDTINGKALSMRSTNPLDINNYNEDTIYKDLNGRYENIFSHMNMLWCDGHGFEDCSKCSMYARMLVEVFDKINELSGRDMSRDLCSYHKEDK